MHVTATNAGPSTVMEQRFRYCSRLVAGCAALIGVAGLAGWYLHVEALKRFLPGAEPIRPNMAFIILLGAAALLSPARGLWRHLSRVLAALLLLLATLSIFEYASRIDLVFDGLLLGYSTPAPALRISHLAALGASLLGLALLLIDWQPAPGLVPYQYFAVATIGCSLLGLLGYTFSADSFYSTGFNSRISFPAALACALLGIACLLSRPDVGWMRLVASSRAGGRMLRRLLPAAVGAPWLIGWISVEGSRRGIYTAQQDQVFFAAPLILCFTLLLFFNSRSLERADKERETQKSEVDRLNCELEDRVERRTAELAGAVSALQAEAVERQRTEQVRSRLAEILEATPDFVSTADRDGTIRYLNRSARKMVGLGETEDLQGLRIEQLQPEWAAGLVLGEGLTVAARDGSWRGDTAILSRSGQEIPTSEVIIPHRAPAGDVQYFSTVMRDISERKSHEAELKRLNRALQALSRCNQAIARATEERQLLQEVSRTVVEIGGYRMAYVGYREYDPGKTVRPVAIAGHEAGYLQNFKISWDVEKPDGRGPCGTSIRTGQLCVVRDVNTNIGFAPWREEALKRGYASTCAVPLMDGDKAFAVLAIYSGQADAFDANERQLVEELAANLSFGIMAVRSGTERKRAERLLQESEERYRSLVLATSLIVWTTDPQGQVVGDMPAWRKFTGMTVEQIMGSGWLNSLHPADRQHTALVWAQSVAQRALYETEYRIRRNDGEYRDMWVRGVPVLDDHGNLREWVGTCTDISERKRTDEALHRAHDELEDRVRERTAELAAANQELEAFTSSVSHDLRAPLRHIQSFSKLLLDGHSAQLDDEGRHYLQRICDGGKRLSGLVDDLLNLSRIGRQELQVHPTPLNEVVEAVVHELDTSGRAIDWKIGALPVVVCDHRLMKQVFFNLLENAVKFTRLREHAVIEVETVLVDGGTTVLVRDNGVGFDMKYASRLFGIFQRLHRSEEFEGTGVGLATVARIIWKHGGRVWAEAESDRGATFYFTLGPAEAAPGNDLKNEDEKELACMTTK